eukprot:gene18000-24411_t
MGSGASRQDAHPTSAVAHPSIGRKSFLERDAGIVSNMGARDLDIRSKGISDGGM